MLAIAFSGQEVRYIHWTWREEEVQLVACQVLPWERKINPFRDVNRLRDMIQQIVTETGIAGQSSVYLALDADFCRFSLLEVDPGWDVREQLEFTRRSRLGAEPVYTSFHYAVGNGAGRYLNVDCPVVLRRGVQAALPQPVDGPHVLSIGVFSAFSYTRRVVPGLEQGRWLFWRVSEHGPDQILEIQNDRFRALHLFRRSRAGVRPLATVGNRDLQQPIADFIEQLQDGEDAPFPEVENVFAYLGSGGTDFLEQVFAAERGSLSLLNPFWRWSWPDVPEADNRFTQSAFTELADAVWTVGRV